MSTERFISLVNQSSGSDACWPWLARIDRDGYGRFHYAKRSRYAHRIAYEFFIGPIDSGLEIDHLCHTLDQQCPGGRDCLHRRCVNPSHLEVVTRLENGRRGRSPQAINATKTHCSRGHPFDEANTYIFVVGSRPHRICRACNREAVRRYKTRRLAEAAS